MAMSDCERCWGTPCICGWDYRNWPLARLENQKRIFDAIIDFKKRYPEAHFSEYSEKRTPDDETFYNFITNPRKE